MRKQTAAAVAALVMVVAAAATGCAGKTGARDGSPAAASSAAIGAELAARDRTILVRAKEYRFEPARIELRKGDRVTIRFTNVGTEKHEWELPAFKAEIEPIKPGATATLTFTADRTGVFEYACHVDGHYKKRMRGYLIVR